ncbi:hypothetical protein NA56DRAFT_750950 [Hyaloscypha hepaticicola]|uniref:Uncharacterized protein n=1 Tax=Hyaloscypha hepaticicola TaxID=2082293 RepID=A0A2J6PYG9_9HELO|nr:hypothetical protein NA56DRAFT_750950 [Hyaloscypha hepaticicola]
MRSFSTFILLGLTCSAIAEFTAGQRSALFALRSVFERQVQYCTPIEPPYTCERSCGPAFRTCIAWPTCYNPSAGEVCCSNGDYCPEGQYCTDNGCCPDGSTLAECNASVSLSVIPPAAETTVPAAASTGVAAATTTSPSLPSTPASLPTAAFNTTTTSSASSTVSPKSKSAQTPGVTPTLSANTIFTTNSASVPTTSVIKAGGAGQAFGVDVFHLALGWLGAIFLEVNPELYFVLFHGLLSRHWQMDRHYRSFTARNSLAAITVLKRDPTTGLFVPVEILVLEKAQNDEASRASTGCKDSDANLEVLVRDVLA